MSCSLYRCILKLGSRLGSYRQESGSYDGLLGSLQKGDLDLVAMPVYYPLYDPDGNFTYSPAMSGDTMTMCSGYNVSRDSHEGNIFSMIFSVSSNLWLSYLATFLIFTVLISYGMATLGKPFSSIWKMVSASLEHYNFDSRFWFVRTASMATIICASFILTYIKNSFRTELVSIDEPIVIKTYGDIINRNITSALSPVFPDYEKFENAPDGTDERALFQNSLSVSPANANLEVLLRDSIKQKVVIIGCPLTALTISYVLLGFVKLEPNYRMLLTLDENAKSYANVFAFHSKFKGTQFEGVATQM